MIAIGIAATVAGLVFAGATLAAAAAGRLRNPPLVVAAGLLVAWELMMLLNATAVQTRYSAALAAAADSGVAVVAYQPGLSYWVNGDPVFQGFCELNSFLFSVFGLGLFTSNCCVAFELYVRVRAKGKLSEFGSPRLRDLRGLVYLLVSIGIPVVMTGIITALRPAKAYYVWEAYCDQDCSAPVKLIMYVVIPGVFAMTAVALVLLSLPSYARKRREILDTIASLLLERRQTGVDTALYPGSNLPPQLRPPTLRRQRDTPPDWIDSGVPDLTEDDGGQAALMGLLQFMQRMILWCSAIAILALIWVAVAAQDVVRGGLDSGYSGTSLELAIASIVEPSVVALGMFLCFGTGWSARSGYVAIGSALQRAFRRRPKSHAASRWMASSLTMSPSGTESAPASVESLRFDIPNHNHGTLQKQSSPDGMNWPPPSSAGYPPVTAVRRESNLTSWAQSQVPPPPLAASPHVTSPGPLPYVAGPLSPVSQGRGSFPAGTTVYPPVQWGSAAGTG
ncbi:hypothetical protein HK405_006691, partial [Cladochytrium tenue]